MTPMNPGPRILIVDDNSGMLETLSDIITASGMQVDTAGDGAAALALCARESYAAAVIDVVLPDTNGAELVRRMRKDHPATRFVLITAYTDSESLDYARTEPVDAILHKPLEPERLLSTLRRLVAPR
jgi:two-component system capsular synthesis sensor histidine kinase RcsC